MRTLYIGLLALSVSVLSACDGLTDFQRGRAIKGAGDAGGQALETLALPKTGQAGGGRTERSIRVVLTPTQVFVDNSAFLGDLDALGELAKFDGDSIAPKLVSKSWPADKGVPGSELADQLKKALAIEAELAKHPKRAIEVFVDGTVDFAAVASVAAALANSGATTFRYAVEVDREHLFVEAAAPTSCDAKPDCVVPVIELREGGAQVTAYGPTLDGKRCDSAVIPLAIAPSKVGEAEWSGKVVIAESGKCPSVPSHKDKQDLHTLQKLLRDTSAMAPGCNVAVLTSATSNWGETVEVISSMRNHSPFPRIVLAPKINAAPRISCADAIVPSKLEGVATRKKKDRRKTERLSIMGHLDDMEE